MKKSIITILISLCVSSLPAQEIVKGDMNDDGKITIQDVTEVINTLNGKSPLKTISSNNLFADNNSLITGTWYRSKSQSITFNMDGSTDFLEGHTYKYKSNRGVIIIYNECGVPVSALDVFDLTDKNMILCEHGINNPVVYYSTKPVVKVSSIILDKDLLSLGLDDTYTLTASVFPIDADDTSYLWSTTNQDIAVVTKYGKIVPIDYGECHITCTANDGSGIQAICKVKVEIQRYINLPFENRVVDSKGDKFTVNIDSNVPYKISTNASWLTISEDAIVVSPNNEPSSRIATITVSNEEYNIEKSFTIEQSPNITTLPATVTGVQAVLRGISPYYAGVNRGFLFWQKDKPESKMLITSTGENTNYSALLTDITPNTRYCYQAVYEPDGANCYGMVHEFVTGQQPIESDGYTELLDGDYIIQNVETGLYLNGANTWGTKASATKHGQFMTAAKMSDGTYTIDTHFSNSKDQHYLGGDSLTFLDSRVAYHTIEMVAPGIFTIKDDNEKYLTVSKDNLINFVADEITDATKWHFITREQILASLENATYGGPADATALIGDANFSRNNVDFDMWNKKPAKGGPNENQLVEMWGGSSQTFTSAQTITNLPNGLYTLKAQGFYRYNNTTDNTNEAAAAAHADGTEVIYSYLFANNSSVALTSIADEAAVETYGKMPFGLREASAAFAAGLYQNELSFEITDGTITLGVKKIEHIGCDWTVWDNFELYYHGSR